MNEFETRHTRHIKAIKNGDLILAAEILKSIYELSTDLDRDEFWTRENIKNPDARYSLCMDAFATGDLIELYAGKKQADLLALKSGSVQHCRDYSVSKEDLSGLKSPSDLYIDFLPSRSVP